MTGRPFGLRDSDPGQFPDDHWRRHAGGPQRPQVPALAWQCGNYSFALCVGGLFHRTEKLRVDVKDAVQAMVTTNQTLETHLQRATAANLLAARPINGQKMSLIIIYSYGDFRAATAVARSDETAAKPDGNHARQLRSAEQSRRISSRTRLPISPRRAPRR
jgi:hypothetical protein